MLQRVLSRNGWPHRLIDTDEDADAQGVLACLDLTTEQLPVAVASRLTVQQGHPVFTGITTSAIS